jgi:hypothetical protein
LPTFGGAAAPKSIEFGFADGIFASLRSGRGLNQWQRKVIVSRW